MEQIVVDDENKKGIYEHIQSSIGYYSEYKKEIEEFFSTGILDKDLATRILENLIYSCKITKFNLKPDEEFKDDRRNADEIFNQIPKGKDFHEDGKLVYVRERMTVVQEEKWYQKLFNLIKNLFDRNK